MCQFIESICLKDGIIRNLDLHQTRIDKTFNAYFPESKVLNLSELLANIPKQDEKCKIRVVYSSKNHLVEWHKYQFPEIKTFELVHENSIQYQFKSAQRLPFEALKSKSKSDEIIIVKNQKITDTSFSNLIFFDGKDWITPKTYLLNGIMRQKLLHENKIIAKDIQISDLNNYSSFQMINAMNTLFETKIFPISALINLA